VSKTLTIGYRLVLASVVLLTCSGCVDEAFMKESAIKFADQHFKTTIALIELHRLRTGEYPDQLEDVRFLGDWDKASFTDVLYEKLPEGYGLDIVGPGEPARQLVYPPEFWNGLGLVRSNVK
jgi:hypothetical protein